jgi:hypothetical protein
LCPTELSIFIEIRMGAKVFEEFVKCISLHRTASSKSFQSILLANTKVEKHL